MTGQALLDQYTVTR